jgi:hypothetical protein
LLPEPVNGYKATKRKQCVEVDDLGLRWVDHRLPARASLDGLLENNYAAYARVLQSRVNAVAERAANEPQMELPLASALH